MDRFRLGRPPISLSDLAFDTYLLRIYTAPAVFKLFQDPRPDDHSYYRRRSFPCF